jgi:hypothetical protein
MPSATLARMMARSGNMQTLPMRPVTVIPEQPVSVVLDEGA